MAAPSGTVWGSVYGNYAKMGFYITKTTSNTQVTVTCEVWYWSKYGTADSVNTFYFDNLASSGSATTSKGSVSINTNVNSGSGWSTSNQSKLATYTWTYNRSASNVTRYLYAKLANVETVHDTVYANTTFVVDKIPTYTVSYNANGGSGAPSAQTKLYGTNLTLSTTKPTRAGYTFQGWATSSAGSVAYAAGASYTGNANLTLYAVWKINTYTVSYNANGGSGAPGNQTKTYGVTLTLSSTKPTRANYNFKGWATSASGSVAYAAGGSYTGNANLTLYAVWELAYKKPTISISTVARCTDDGTASDAGTYIKVAFSWTTYYNSTTVKIEWKSNTDSGWSSSAQTTGSKSGTVNVIVGDGLIDIEKTYTVKITVADSNGSVDTSRSVNSMSFPIDVLAGGKGVAIGKVAETANWFDVNYNTRLRKTSILSAGHYCHFAGAGGGNSGYIKFANITPIAFYADKPVRMKIMQRYGLEGSLYMHFSGSSVLTDQRLSLCRVNGTISNIYTDHIGNGSYDIYILKSHNWDEITVMDVEIPCNSATVHFDIKWYDECVATLPSTASPTSRGNWLNEAINMPNATAIYMANASGTYRNALHMNVSNSLNLGYGGYKDSEGATVLYGNTIEMIARSGDISFNRPIKSTIGVIELVGGTPYIDFHFGNSRENYTARIIERSSGALTVYNTISNASDRNLKKDIDDLPTDYLKVLKALKPSQYRFINGDDYLNVGFIAQDVEDAFVDAGFVDIPIVNNDDGVYGLDYNGFIAMLVQGYQEQQKEIESLRKTINNLEARLSALENLQNGESEDN